MESRECDLQGLVVAMEKKSKNAKDRKKRKSIIYDFLRNIIHPLT